MKTNYLLLFAILTLGFACDGPAGKPGGTLGAEMNAVDSLQQLYPSYADRAANTITQIEAMYAELKPSLDLENSKHAALVRQFDTVLDNHRQRLAKNRTQIKAFEIALEEGLEGEELEKEYKKMRMQYERMLKNFERTQQDLERLTQARDKLLAPDKES